jgi:two-component system sensor histidine kinase/response regulator
MRFLYWINRHTEIYALLSAVLVVLALLLMADNLDKEIEANRDIQLAETQATYSATLESGTINSRAMGAVMLFGQFNPDAKLLAQGKLPPDAPQVVSALNALHKLYNSESAYLVNQHNVIAAYSGLDNRNRTGLNLSFRPFVQLAMQGYVSVYPNVGIIDNQRGIVLAAPVHAGQDITSKSIGTVVIRISAGRVDALLKAWNGGPAVLLSPQGIVFASSRADWLFHVDGEINAKRLDQIRRLRQFGDIFDQASPLSLPFTLRETEADIDGVRHVVRSRSLEWDDPAGDWTLVLLDKRDPWWTQWKVLGLSGLAGLMVALMLFWLHSMARNVALRHEIYQEHAIAAATFEAREGIMITDANGRIIRVNQAFTEITGYTSAEAVGKTPALLSSGRQDAEFYARMWNSIKHEKNWRGEIWNKRKNGEIYPEQLTITSIFDEHGQLANYVGIFSDITQRKATEEEIHHLAF